ncbi:MAG: T9SS type A sorting domain-containing protein [Deinococcales bacterium]|nr:T9SS type A sorting domain-containing protein [Chitinophagaceae bacterium]
MKKLITLFVLATVVIFFQSSVKGLKFSGQPPEGLTGASGSYCTNCHSSFGLNSGGGNVSVSGLPSSNYNAGQVYNFSLAISHGTADRKRWGFSIAAVNGNGVKVGTFSTTNNNAGANGDELSHNNAVTTGSQASFTYNNLIWTAPINPSAADQNVTFFYVGNAANGNGGSGGDYIYAGSSNTVLPIELKAFTATVNNTSVLLQWQSATEINSDSYAVQRSEDGQFFYNITTIKAAGNSGVAKSYSYTDNKPAYFDKPIYYRLKLIDKDNSFKFSAVVNVQVKATGTVVKNLYPSLTRIAAPINAVIESNKQQTITIAVVDANGKMIQQLSKNITLGTNTITFNLSNGIASGMNFIKFSGDNLKQTIAIMVQK